MKHVRSALALASLAIVTSCVMDRAPSGLRRTPPGPGAAVRYDLSHKPLPEIPLPTDSATWPDPTSRTGLRVNASLVAPTAIERGAREKFSQMEGWGTYAPISVAFDIDRSDPEYQGYEGPALDLENLKERHQGDDYDFANDAVYLVNLTTGVPLVLDLGNGAFNYTLKKLDKYWPNDTRRSERNLLFETIDESQGGAITPGTFKPEHDTDFDGTLDIPNLFGKDPTKVCPGPDLVCDDASSPAEQYNSPECFQKRRDRDRCIADNLMHWYERETDALILRPLIPMDEMTRYAVVITDRTRDGKGHSVKSPFEYIYHVTMEAGARRVMEIIDDPSKKNYFGDIAGSGLDHVAFTWTFTTQPTVDDMKRLRDGLFGQGPFARWEKEFPATIEVQRAVGLQRNLEQGATEDPGWETSQAAINAGCPALLEKKNLHVVSYDALRSKMKQLIVEGFEVDDGPGVEAMLRAFDHVDHMVIGTFKAPFLLEGGPKSTDPNAAFHLNFLEGTGEVNEDEIQFWLIVPKETAEFKQPFNVNIYGHGYTGYFIEQILYAGNMAQHGLATIGINAMGHGLVFDNATAELAASSVLGGACVAPFYDALTQIRARDLNRDGIADSGGDFWSSYLFHTRDGVRQSILDHLQLVRLLRAFGSDGGQMLCQNEKTGWDKPATEKCDLNGDGTPEVNGDFDADGRPDIGGPDVLYGTWGESLGGILSAIHGSIDAYVTAAVPGSGGGGLTDIGIRSFQGGVVEAVLLRIWGPLVVSVPATERPECKVDSKEDDHCTLCAADQISLRWVMPDLNGTGETEIACLSPGDIADTTVYVENKTNGELRCARVAPVGPDQQLRMRVGIPTSVDDEIEIRFFAGRDMVEDYGSCRPLYPTGTLPKTTVNKWGKGRYGSGSPNGIESEICNHPTCTTFQGRFFGEGTPLTAPAEGFGQIRQTPALRRFIQLAQAALDPGDPINFAPFYSIKQMTDPYGKPIAPHAVLTLNTIGDMNVPLNSGIDFARANAALPFLRPEQAALYPEYADYATPQEIYDALGMTPNQALINQHVIEGITALGRHPARAECAASANARDMDATFLTYEDEVKTCYPTGCATAGVKCYSQTHCDDALDRCVPNALGQLKCEEALFDADDLDEGTARYHEQNLPVPMRLGRYTQAATPSTVSEVWAPRIGGVPHSPDATAWKPDGRPLTAMLNAYVIPEGQHCFENGEPCQSFDFGTYLTNLTARFFMTDGRDLYYLSHPSSHLCLGTDVTQCGYLNTNP